MTRPVTVTQGLTGCSESGPDRLLAPDSEAHQPEAGLELPWYEAVARA